MGTVGRCLKVRSGDLSLKRFLGGNSNFFFNSRFSSALKHSEDNDMGTVGRFLFLKVRAGLLSLKGSRRMTSDFFSVLGIAQLCQYHKDDLQLVSLQPMLG